MFTRLSYNMYFEMAMIPVDLVIMIFVLKSYKDDNESGYRFKIFSSFVTISTALDVVTALVHSMGNALPFWFRMVFNTFDCFIAFFSALSFSLYMVAFSGKNSISKVQKTMDHIINLAYSLILVVNLFVPIAFTFDESGKYVHGPLFSVIVFVFPLYYAFEGIIIAYRNKKNFTTIQLFCLRGALILTIFFFALQMFFVQNTMLTFYTSSLAMVILFMVLETPDMSKLDNVMEELAKARKREMIANEKFKVAIEVKAKFLTYLSHEMKTPINAILGYSEQIVNSNIDPNVKKQAENVLHSAQRLNKFFSEVIDEAINHNEYNKDEEIVFNSDGYNIVANPAGGPPMGPGGPGMRPGMGPGMGMPPMVGGPGMGPGMGMPPMMGGPGMDDFAGPSSDDSRMGSATVYGDSLHRFGYKRDSAQYKILCVDDNELNMELLLRILGNFGFSTDTAVNGLEAIDKVKKCSYDLILMDHMMPGMDGIDAMHIIRNDGLCDLTPIIVVTANAVKGEKEKYLMEGFDSYIPKPFSGGSILRIIGKFLPVAMMDTLVKYNDSVGISRFMLASTFSRPVISPGCRMLVAGTAREEISRIARLLLTTMSRIDIAYNGDDCLHLLSTVEYDMIFVEEDLTARNNRAVKAYIWNNISSPSISIISSGKVKDPAVLYESFTDYIDSGCGPEIIDAMLLLYLPKDKVYVVGSGRYEKTENEFYDTPVSDIDPYDIPHEDTEVHAELPEEDPFAMEEDDYVLPEFISGIPGIDIDTGIGNCGSGEGFVRALDIFASSAGTKASEIRKFYEEGDITAYTIQVHALKSSARIIGALELSELAFELEQAGNAKNGELIKQKTDTLLSMYEDIASKISAGQNKGDDSDKEPADPEMLKDAYSSIFELGSMMDYDSIEMILGQLDNYSFEKEDSERIAKIREGLDELNWDKVVQSAKEAL